MAAPDIIAAFSRDWYAPAVEALRSKVPGAIHVLRTPQELTLERVRALAPRYVFFLHWSHYIPAEIHDNFECVIFHMTDVPFGRGGSPLQNLIARGFHETKLTALRCGAGLDAGPVYMKRPLSLEGSAEEIYLRAAGLMEGMIAEIVRTQPEPEAQRGEPVIFPRRKPAEGDLAPLATLTSVFDFIRMLDADGYPKAFLETEHFRFEFTRAGLKSGSVQADVRITKK